MAELFSQLLLDSHPFGYSRPQYKGMLIGLLEKFDSEVELRTHRDIGRDEWIKGRLSITDTPVVWSRAAPLPRDRIHVTTVDLSDATSEERRRDLEEEYDQLTLDLVKAWHGIRSKKHETQVNYYKEQFTELMEDVDED